MIEAKEFLDQNNNNKKKHPIFSNLENLIEEFKKWTSIKIEFAIWKLNRRAFT